MYNKNRFTIIAISIQHPVLTCLPCNSANESISHYAMILCSKEGQVITTKYLTK